MPIPRPFIRLALVAFFCGAPLAGQEPPAPARPPEGSLIINFPSAEVNRAGTLQLLFTHRFSDPVQGSSIRSLYTFDSGADVGIGLSYTPLENLEIALLRSRTLQDYELSAKYRFLSSPENPVGLALRVGGNGRTEVNLTDRTGFFAQAIAAVTLFSRVRVAVLPTYVSKAAGQPFVLVRPIRKDVFNVPAALSVAVTRSINVQGEVVPRRADSPGVGWIVAIEKTVLRHRFAFTAGNLRTTTVDQYIAPDFGDLMPKNIYLGFNLVRQWKLK